LLAGGRSEASQLLAAAAALQPLVERMQEIEGRGSSAGNSESAEATEFL
jgi:hypothetical protein